MRKQNKDTACTCNFRGIVGTEWEQMSDSKDVRKGGSSRIAWGIGKETGEGETGNSVALQTKMWCYPRRLVERLDIKLSTREQGYIPYPAEVGCS